MAKQEKRVQIEMRQSVVGEDGDDWFAGEVYSASASVAYMLVSRGRAVEVESGGGTARGRGRKAASE